MCPSFKHCLCCQFDMKRYLGIGWHARLRVALSYPFARGLVRHVTILSWRSAYCLCVGCVVSSEDDRIDAHLVSAKSCKLEVFAGSSGRDRPLPTWSVAGRCRALVV